MAASSAAANNQRPSYAVNPVAVVSVCEQNLSPILEGIAERVDIAIMKHVDLRGLIKDPLAALGHKEDGSFAQTQEVVFGQDTFADVMKDTIGKVFFQPELSVVVVNCKHAMHRADVATRILTDVLNSIENAAGQRMFNVSRFQCGRNHCYGEKDFLKKLRDVCDWVEDPWTFVEGSADSALSARFGYEASRRSRAASENFDDIWDFVTHIQHKEDPGSTTAAAIAFGNKFEDATSEAPEKIDLDLDLVIKSAASTDATATAAASAEPRHLRGRVQQHHHFQINMKHPPICKDEFSPVLLR